MQLQRRAPGTRRGPTRAEMIAMYDKNINARLQYIATFLLRNEACARPALRYVADLIYSLIAPGKAVREKQKWFDQYPEEVVNEIVQLKGDWIFRYDEQLPARFAPENREAHQDLLRERLEPFFARCCENADVAPLDEAPPGLTRNQYNKFDRDKKRLNESSSDYGGSD